MKRSLIIASCLLAGMTAIAQAGSSTVSGVSNSMNPALSVNALANLMHSTENGGADLNGIHLEEAEMHFTSVVDPFWKANVILSAYPVDSGRGYEINLEEANIDGTALPAGVALKLGKFFVPFGKHSPLHTHQFPFANAPMAVSRILGEGLTEMGVELSYGPPLPWYNDLIVYGLSGDTDIFDNTSGRTVIGGRWSNLWDTSENATLELGASVLSGPGSADYFARAGDVTVKGCDLTWKWVDPNSSHGPALTVMGELLMPEIDSVGGDPMGWYLLSQYRLKHSWWAGVEYGRLDAGDGAGPASGFDGEYAEFQINLTFAPSEFSAIRFGLARFDDRIGDDDDLQVSMQWNFTIGSHPAHMY